MHPSIRVGSSDRKADEHMGNWRKSTYSTGSGGSCVELANGAGVVLVRDTTDRDGGTLAFPASAWSAFMRSVRQG